MRIGAPLAGLFIAWRLYRIVRQPETVPDLLGELGGKYFESNGLCFGAIFETHEEHGSIVSIYFQNRYDGHASARVMLQPPGRPFWSRKPPVPTVGAIIECPGGAFGVVRLPFDIPDCHRGASVRFRVGADTKYSKGRGEMLRFRNGIRVGSIDMLAVGSQVAATILMLFLGLIYVSSPAYVTVTLPADAGEKRRDPARQGIREILWEPNAPSFPAIPPRVAA
jgi:hypothetical protein